VALQKRFFDFFSEKQTQWVDKQPRVLLNVRTPARNSSSARERMAACPHEMDQALSRPGQPFASDVEKKFSKTKIEYDPMGDALPFHLLQKKKRKLQTVGTETVHLFGDHDADIFACCVCSILPVRLLHGRGGAVPGRARSEDAGRAGLAARVAPQARPKMSLPYRPWHSHDEIQKLIPAKPRVGYRDLADCIVVPPAGASRSASAAATTSTILRRRRFQHEEPDEGLRAVHARGPTDRPPAVFGGKVTLHFDKKPFLPADLPEK